MQLIARPPAEYLGAGDPRFAVSATDVLADGVGWCSAQAHLLAAVLRAGGVPTEVVVALRRGELAVAW